VSHFGKNNVVILFISENGTNVKKLARYLDILRMMLKYRF